MSFLPISEENKEAPTGKTTNAPGTETQIPPQTGGSVGEEAGGAPPKTSASGSPTQFGSSASKLGDYLSANAPQIGQQADTLAGNLNQQYGNLTQGITDAANQFQQSVQGGYTAANPDLVSQALQDPTAFVSNPENVQGFQKQYNDAYTGPLSFEGTAPYADIQGKVGQAVQQGNLLGTQAGLQSYLQGNAPNPTQAMSTLDALLLRGNPEAQQKIQTAAGQFGNLTDLFGTATQGANQKVLEAQDAAQTAQNYARQGVADYSNPLTEKLNKQFAANQLDYGNRGADMQKLYQLMNTPTGGSLTKEQAASLGLQPGQYEQIQGINYAGSGIALPNFNPLNPGQFYTQSTNQAMPPTIGSSATPEQIAAMQALSQLTGGGYQAPFDLSQVPSPYQLPQAGTFNYEGAKKAAVQNLLDTYNHDYQNVASIYDTDPYIGSKLKSVAQYLANVPEYSNYAPTYDLPDIYLQPPNAPPSGHGGVFY